jgi:hypothetical protein
VRGGGDLEINVSRSEALACPPIGLLRLSLSPSLLILDKNFLSPFVAESFHAAADYISGIVCSSGAVTCTHPHLHLNMFCIAVVEGDKEGVSHLCLNDVSNHRHYTQFIGPE